MSGGQKTPRQTLGGISRQFAGDLGFRAATELISAACGLYVFALLSRMLGQSGDYAVLNQIAAMGSLIAPLLLCRMNTAFCVFLPGDKDQSRVRSRFAAMFLITLAIGVAFCAAAAFPARELALFLWGDARYERLLLPMAVYYVLLALSLLCQAFLQATGHQKKSNAFVLVSSATNVIGYSLLAFLPSTGVDVLSRSIDIYLIAAATTLLGQIGVLLWDWRGVRIRLRREELRPMYNYALPLLPVTVMAWFNSYIGRFLLNHLVSDELRSASVYGFYDSLTSRAFLINAVLVYTIFPYIAKAWNQHNREQVVAYLHKSFNIGLFVAVPIIFGLVLVCPTIVHWLAGGNYPTNRGVLLVLCLAQLFQMLYMNFSYLIDLSRKTQWYNGIFLLSTLVNVLLCLLLIPYIGMMGCAVGLMVSYGLQLFVGAFISHHMAGISVTPDLIQAIKAVLSSCLMYLVCHGVYFRGNPEPVGGAVSFALTVGVGIAVYFGCQWGLSKLTKTKML